MHSSATRSGFSVERDRPRPTVRSIYLESIGSNVESKKMIRKKEEIEEERRKNAAKAPVACVSERIFVLALNRVLAHYLCKYPAGMR